MTRKQRSALKPTPPEDIALSLSGGGHRATLFGLGVLLALVDRGLNRRVKQIASVSGGSIVNAFVALHTDYSDPNLKPDAFDEIAAKLVQVIVQKGVLTRTTIFVLLFGLFAPPLGFIVLALHGILSWYFAAVMVGLWLAMALLRGLVIEWLIELRYFPPTVKVGLFPPKLIIRRKVLQDLQNCSLEHAFCCTDLVEPGPAYFSSASVGKSLAPGSFFSGFDHQKTKWIQRSAASLPIAAVVRASAAFPGIPPRLIRFRSSLEEVAGYQNIIRQSLFDPTPQLKKTVVLADGGVWNNLGTQVLRESDWDSFRYSDMVLITADASVPTPSQRVTPYWIPGWALFRSLLRISNIQHENTVELRLERMRQRIWEQLFGSGRSIREQSRLDALVDELGLNDMQKDTFLALNNEGYLSATEPWDIPVSLSARPDWPLGIYLDLIANIPGWKHVYGAVKDASHRGGKLFELAKFDVSRLKTHLDRVQKNDAMGILARGYLGAFLWTAGIKPLEESEIDLMERVPERLSKMVAR